jgi:hypothetical protein
MFVAAPHALRYANNVIRCAGCKERHDDLDKSHSAAVSDADPSALNYSLESKTHERLTRRILWLARVSDALTLNKV